MDTSATPNVKHSNVECTLFVVFTKREAVMRNNLSKLQSGLECSCTRGHGRHANRWRCGESGGLWWRILGGMPISDIHRFRPTFILAGYVDGLQGKLKRI